MSSLLDAIRIVFPYQDLQGPFERQITPLFVLLIIVYFVAMFISLLIPIVRLRKRLLGYATGISETKLENDKVLGKLWHQYSRTFIGAGEKRLTEVEAESIFDESSVVAAAVSLRYWASVPGILLALGIFGTFLGLTLGVRQFDTTNSEAIRQGIQHLLSGMATAFLTSLWGMALSILFNTFEKVCFRSIGKAASEFNYALDRRYRMSRIEFLKWEQKNRDELARRFLSYQSNGETVYTSFALRDMLHESKEQTKALKAFSTDLADTIMGMGDRLSGTLSSKLEPFAQSLAVAIEDMRKHREESSAQFLRELVQNLQQTTRDMLDDVRKSLTENVVEELSGLAKVVTQAGQSMEKVPDQMQQTMVGLSEGMEGLRSAITDSSQEAVRQTQLSMENFQSRTDEVLKAFQKQMEVVQASVTDLMTQQQKQAQQLRDLVTEFNGTISRVTDVSRQIGDASERLVKAGDTLSSASELAAASNKSLHGTVEIFGAQAKELSGKYDEVLAELKSIVEESARAAEKAVQQYRTIEEGLRGIFQEIERGLTDYQRISREGINNYLSGFSENVTGAVQGLAGSLEQLEEFLDTFGDVVEALKKKAETTPGNGT